MESKLPACAPNQYSLLSLHVPTDTEVNVCVYQETPRYIDSAITCTLGINNLDV